MTSFYSGIAPSSSHPSLLFEGCFRKEIQLNGAFNKNETPKKGRSLEIGRLVLEKVLEGEIAEHAATHIHDHDFTRKLIDSVAQILPRESPAQSVLLGARLAELGKALLHLHQNRPYLQPFAVQSENILFAIDRLDNNELLPKFNNFVDERPVDFPTIRISFGDGSTWGFYQIIPHPRCVRCSAPLVAAQTNSTQPILIEFPLKEESGWKYPECVHYISSDVEQWSTKGATLTGLNASHAACLFR
ncbi:unnamed protein product, partial [Mesorhabditis belari]|uniref:Uncharacterized protein n=1 Tax=Mesorhabditis belari TaxID=2138241 RepID=A0AAF3FLJ1_9BILA